MSSNKPSVTTTRENRPTGPYRDNRKIEKNDFEILSVLRNLKIIGIFTRLAIRDRKKKYMKMIPYAWKMIEHRMSENFLFKDLEIKLNKYFSKKNTFYRPWGRYTNLFNGNNFLIKEIHVKSKGILSLQKHFHRSEHWVVTEGMPKITLNKKFFSKKNNEKFLFNLRDYVNNKLSNFGVHNIDNINADTFKDTDNFFSYRRSQKLKEADYGRCISTICLVKN